MSANLDFEVFDGKSFKDLCKEVVERSQSKKDQLDTLVSDLRTLIKGPNDVGQFMPRIKELLEVGIKNDEQIQILVAREKVKLLSSKIAQAEIDKENIKNGELLSTYTKSRIAINRFFGATKDADRIKNSSTQKKLTQLKLTGILHMY